MRRLLERALPHPARAHGARCRAGRGVARVTVRDEGPGLQPYEARHAFERFWRGNRDAAGSGLGLAIVRATAERHGGRAYVEGAAFSVEVPAVRDFSESAGTTGAPPEKGFR